MNNGPLSVVSCQLSDVRGRTVRVNERFTADDGRRTKDRRAFTLIEMLTVVAVLIVVLGLMVSLARYVRDQSAQVLTRKLLGDLDNLMAQYMEHNGGRLPVVEAVPPKHATDAIENVAFLQAARKNNEQFIRALKADYRSRRTDITLPVDPFEQQPISVYDLRTMRDAWGTPIIFMPGQHPQIGMAPSRVPGQDQCFFFSAGPDRKYLTRDDNLYSYERPAAGMVK
jgi:type II secretory pathway pseudopilin PulG